MATPSPLENSGCSIQDPGFNFTFASPLPMGATQINPDRALDLGLIYDATTHDCINFVVLHELIWQSITKAPRKKPSRLVQLFGKKWRELFCDLSCFIIMSKNTLPS